jgi:hypothetical protein
MENRTLSTIAREISSDWKKVNFAAVPYLQAMATMESPQDNFGYDSGQSVVLYFLSNATTWRGDVARRIKKELKAMI